MLSVRPTPHDRIPKRSNVTEPANHVARAVLAASIWGKRTQRIPTMSTANQPSGGNGEVRSVRTVGLDTAKTVVEAAERKAAEISVPMNIAVVDRGGNLVAFERMDDAWLASTDIAISKAFTAASLTMPTEDLAEPTQPGESLYGLNTTNDGRLVVFGGGIPLVQDEEVVGAVGVSGGSVEQDVEVAQASVDAFTGGATD